MRLVVVALFCAAAALTAVRPALADDGQLQERSLMYSSARRAAEEHGGQSGFRLLAQGTEAFAFRIGLIDQAEATLDLQYYIVHEGFTTTAIIQRVLAAADRGVRVRILIDDTASHGNDFAVGALSAHDNIAVRVFNPIRAGRSFGVTRGLMLMTNLNRLHRRMHNKLFVVDGAVAITGGRNLGDEYFDAGATQNFTDLDLLATGPVVEDLSASFESYWDSGWALPIEEVAPRRSGRDDLKRLRVAVDRGVEHGRRDREAYMDVLREQDASGAFTLRPDQVTWAHAEVVADAPEKIGAAGRPPDDALLIAALRERLLSVRGRLDMVSPYFVPGDEGVRALGDLAARGVAVRVVTNSLAATDVGYVHGAYRNYREPLLRSGVAIHEMRPLRGRNAVSRWVPGASLASLHTKAMIFGDDAVFVGNFNFDPRSVFWNTEVGVVVESSELAAQLRAIVDVVADSTHSYRVGIDGKGLRWDYTDARGKPVMTRHESGGPVRRFQSWISDLVGPETMM